MNLENKPNSYVNPQHTIPLKNNNYFHIEKIINLDKLKLTMYIRHEKNKVIFQRFHCELCSNILNSPIGCANCQKLFCKKCFDKKYNPKTNKCPNKSCIKGLEFSNLKIIKNFQDDLNNLKIKCPLANPCDFMILVGELQSHVINCENSLNVKICKICLEKFSIQKKENLNEILNNHTNICKKKETLSVVDKISIGPKEFPDNLENKYESQNCLFCEICENQIISKEFHNKDDCIQNLKNKILNLEAKKLDQIQKKQNLRVNFFSF